jgi:hypothetical protein
VSENLAQRIEAVCRAYVGRGDFDPAEARRWFAIRLRVSLRTVERWYDGTRKFQGPALACLEMLEMLAKEIRGYEALAAERPGDTIGDRWERDLAKMRADALRMIPS